MRRRAIPIVITLAILAPGVIAGVVVGGFVAQHHKHSAPLPATAPPTMLVTRGA
jgi:hypothetical protein